MNLKRIYMLAIIAGVISVWAFPPYFVLPIFFASICALFAFNDVIETKKHKFWLGWFFGFGHFAYGFSWVGNALLVDVTNFGWLYPIALIACGSFFGLFFAIPLWLSSYHKNKLLKDFSFVIYFILFEWIRSFIFTGFPWNMAGTIWAFSDEILQVLSVIGAFGLSFFTMLIAVMIYQLTYRETYKNKIYLIYISAIVLLIGGSFLYGYLKLKDNPIKFSDFKVRIVQPAIPQVQKWSQDALYNNFKEHIELSAKDGLDDVDLVIWGETATPYPLDMDKAKLEEITKAIPKNGHLITGLVRYAYNIETGKFSPYNSMFVIDKKGEIKDFYDKYHLVPFGEYIPLKKYLPFNIKKITKGLADFMKGKGRRTLSIAGIPSFSPIICYEVIFPNAVVNEKNKPEWILNLTNDGWYGVSAGPYQHLISAKFRSIEESRTLVRVANSGISAIFDKYGREIASIGLNEKNYVDVFLPNVDLY